MAWIKALADMPVKGVKGRVHGLGLYFTFWALVCSVQLFYRCCGCLLHPPPGLILDIVCLVKDEDGISSIDLQALNVTRSSRISLSTTVRHHRHQPLSTPGT